MVCWGQSGWVGLKGVDHDYMRGAWLLLRCLCANGLTNWRTCAYTHTQAAPLGCVQLTQREREREIKTGLNCCLASSGGESGW